MDKSDAANLEAKLKVMQQHYGEKLSLRFDEIDALWQEISSGAAKPESWEKLYQCVHRLSGSGATFGFPAVSVAAHATEVLLAPWVSGGNASSALSPEMESIEVSLAVLGRTCRQAGAPAHPIAIVATPKIHEHERHKRILIVDDDIFVADYLATFLNRHGFVTERVEDAANTLAKFDAFKPDLVIMDVYLPDGSGIDVAKNLRAQSAIKLPILFLSTKASADSIPGAEIPAGEFLLKPVDDTVLLSMIREQLIPINGISLYDQTKLMQ